MSWIMIVLLAVAAFLILMPMLTYLSARRMVGSRIEGQDLDGRMIYFYTPSCAPCRRMTPIIDRLAQDNQAVVKVDISSDPDAARRFNIRATPTTMLVKDNLVLDVALGARTQTQLEALLKRLD